MWERFPRTARGFWLWTGIYLLLLGADYLMLLVGLELPSYGIVPMMLGILVAAGVIRSELQPSLWAPFLYGILFPAFFVCRGAWGDGWRWEYWALALPALGFLPLRVRWDGEPVLHKGGERKLPRWRWIPTALLCLPVVVLWRLGTMAEVAETQLLDGFTLVLGGGALAFLAYAVYQVVRKGPGAA